MKKLNIFLLALIFCLVLIMPSVAHAHEGSPDFDYYGNEETGWWIKQDCHFGGETLKNIRHRRIGIIIQYLC